MTHTTRVLGEHDDRELYDLEIFKLILFADYVVRRSFTTRIFIDYYCNIII